MQLLLLIILAFIIGSAVGSFLNVVIDRTTRRESILGRSYCDHCKATLKTLDLVPIVSFVTLGARCRYCQKPVSWQYPVVEALSGILFVLSFVVLGLSGQLNSIILLYYFLLVSVIIVVAVIDLKFSLIPTSIVFAASLISLFYNYFTLPSNLFIEHVISAFVAALFFLAIVAVTRGKGMGEGDIVLAFLIGMVLGYTGTLVAIFSGFLLGAIVSVILLLLGKKKFGQTVPFAPFLVIGLLLALFWGQQIFSWYLMVY